MEIRAGGPAGWPPGRPVGEVLVVAQGLPVRGLALLAEVAAARFRALERVDAHELAQFEEVRHPTRLLERLVQLLVPFEHAYVLPELGTQFRDLPERVVEPGLIARHAAVVPQELPELPVKRVDRALAG